MMFCILLYLEQVWIAQFPGGRRLGDILDSSFAYTPIPSISIGVRRMQLVVFWWKLLRCILSYGVQIEAYVRNRLEDMKFRVENTHLRSGPAG